MAELRTELQPREPQNCFLFSELCCALDNLVALVFEPPQHFWNLSRIELSSSRHLPREITGIVEGFCACFSYYEIDRADRNYCCSAHTTCTALTGSST